jgi:ubiquinone/menaquinone biosynthesis C-methylase UbiE
MKKAQSHAEVLSRYVSFPGKVVIDIGCGTGDFVRWMTARGASATGIDMADMVAKAEKFPKSGDEKYLVGTAQEVPVESAHADLTLYLASFHHVPENEMFGALEECKRILKAEGTAIFVEPVGKKGSYYQIVRLVGDERDVQAKAYEAIKAAGRLGFRMIAEETYYLERSFEDYLHLLEVNVESEVKRAEIAAAARAITEGLSRDAGTSFESYRYRSICRMNILMKTM